MHDTQELIFFKASKCLTWCDGPIHMLGRYLEDGRPVLLIWEDIDEERKTEFYNAFVISEEEFEKFKVERNIDLINEICKRDPLQKSFPGAWICEKEIHGS